MSKNDNKPEQLQRTMSLDGQQQQQAQTAMSESDARGPRHDELLMESKSGSDNVEGGAGSGSGGEELQEEDLSLTRPRKKRYHRHTQHQIQEMEAYVNCDQYSSYALLASSLFLFINLSSFNFAPLLILYIDCSCCRSEFNFLSQCLVYEKDVHKMLLVH